jgi:tetratricopeptide (TPR) repeat protein
MTRHVTRRTALLLALLAATLAPPAAAQEQPPAPIALSDADGQELVIEELHVRAAVHGVFSLTEMEIVFHNPHGRRMEGRFTAVLPEGATVSRFAKEVNGRLMEGEVVERLRANRVYAEILHQMRDPALLEQDQGNRFSARIFPIEADARVRVVLGYTRLLPLEGGVRTYHLPLRGLPQIGVMHLEAHVQPLAHEQLVGTSGPEGARMQEGGTLLWEDERFTPTQDLELRWSPRPGATRQYVMRAGDFYLAGVRPDVAPSPPADAAARWVFFLDTSASAADGMDHRLQALRAVLAALPGGEVELVAFDQEVRPLGTFTPSEAAARVEDLVRQRGLLGGTDLHGALAALVARARASGQPGTRFVLVSDGAATVGKTSPAELFRPLDRLPWGTPLHALVLGAREDGVALRQVTGGRGRIVRVPFTERMIDRAAEAAARLALPVGPTLAVRDAGAEAFHAVGDADVQPGGETLVLGRVRPGSASGLVVDTMAFQGAEAMDDDRFGPLLVREFYRAHLEWMQEEERHADGDAARRRLAEEQVRLSTLHRVMVPRTTMLVLETEADYDRFGLDRRSLTEVLTVGPRGIERLDREPAPLLARAEPNDDARDEDAASAEDAPSDASDREEGEVGEGAEAGFAQDVAEREAPEESSAAAGAPPPPPSAPPPPPPPPPAPSSPAQRTESTSLEETVVVTGTPPPISAAPAENVNAGAVTLQNLSLPPLPPQPPPLPEWVRARRVGPGAADGLRARLAANPRDRALYNQLSEALAETEQWRELRDVAFRWQPLDPDNPQVYESLALASHGLGRREEAIRATGSLVEVAPSKPEMLQRAALLLWRVGARDAWEAPARRAVEMRPDLPNPYRTLALLLWQSGRHAEAAEVLERALQNPVDRWYGNAAGVVRDELGYIYRDWMRRSPGRAREIRRRAAEHRVELDRTDRMRITMTWDTDGNDVDLHVVDPRHEHVYYAHRDAESGIQLLEDITQGFGPEVVRTDSVLPGAYHVGVKYFNAGPMGISRGTIVVIEPERGGAVRVRIEPFRLIPERGDIQQVLTLHPAGEAR